MILQNFKLNEDKTELIGISQARLLEFFKRFASSHPPHKMYCLKIVEVNHSQLSRNYLFAILSAYAEDLGYSVDNLEKIMLKNLDILIQSGVDDRYSREVFYDEGVMINKPEKIDTDTGELIEASSIVIESKPKTISKFSNTAMSLFIDFVINEIKEQAPEFIIPDPSEYQFKREGKRNVILFPEDRIKLV